MATSTIESAEGVKKLILDGIREGWNVLELKDSQVTPVKTLSYGWRSKVIQVTVDSNETYIVKTITEEATKQAITHNDTRRKLLLYYKRETNILRKIGGHENIASVYAIMESFKGSPLPAIVMTFYPKRDLRLLVQSDRTIPLKARLELMHDVSRGLTYLHELTPQIIHRDIKGSNILVKEHNGKLRACISDFGSAKFIDETGIELANTTVMSAIQWTPPEYIIDGRPSYSNPTTSGDIWSFGCTFLETLTGRDPWGDEDVVSRLKALKNPPKPNDIDIGADIWSLLMQCWRIRPEFRFDALSIVSFMELLLIDK